MFTGARETSSIIPNEYIMLWEESEWIAIGMDQNVFPVGSGISMTAS